MLISTHIYSLSGHHLLEDMKLLISVLHLFRRNIDCVLLFLLLLTVCLWWHFGIWVCVDYRSQCRFLGLSFLDGCFIRAFYIPVWSSDLCGPRSLLGWGKGFGKHCGLWSSREVSPVLNAGMWWLEGKKARDRLIFWQASVGKGCLLEETRIVGEVRG